MYVIYCQNKPKSEFIVAEYDTYFDVSHPLDRLLSFNKSLNFVSSRTVG